MQSFSKYLQSSNNAVTIVKSILGMNQTWIQLFRHKRDHKQNISINTGQRLPAFHPNSSSYSWVHSWIYFPTSSTGGVAKCLSPSRYTVGGNDVHPFQCRACEILLHVLSSSWLAGMVRSLKPGHPVLRWQRLGWP